MNYPGAEYERFVCENFMFKNVMESDDIDWKYKVIDLFTDYFMKVFTVVCPVDERVMRGWFKQCLTRPLELRDFVIDSPEWKKARDELDRLENKAMADFCEEAGLNVNRDILLIMARDDGLVKGRIAVVPDEKFLKKFA